MKKRILSIILALTMVLSLLPVIRTNATGTLEDPTITSSTDASVDNGDGTTSTTTTTTSLGSGTNESGADVTVQITKTETVTTDSNNQTISESWTSSGTETIVSEKTKDVPTITVDLTSALEPQEGSDPAVITEKSDPVPPIVTPNADGGTTTITETQREVTATVTDVEVIAGSDLGGGYEPDVDVGLEPMKTPWTGNETHIHAPQEALIYYLAEKEDGTTEVLSIPYSQLTDQQKEALNAAQPEGYDYIYFGHGEDSYFGAGWRLPNDRSNYATGTSQFHLMDPETGNVFTGYCADIDTGSKAGYWYKVENLEDAAYYQNKEGAEDHIRAIAMNGYWGTEGKNEDGTPVLGSLDKLKETLRQALQSDASIGLTEADIDALTEGQALTATQMAIWKFGNPYEDIFLTGNTVDVGSPSWIDSDDLLMDEGMSQADVRDATNRITALANYLMSLSMTAEEADTTEIINEDKFVDQMSITVGEMVKDHANNQDQDKTNNAYNVDLTFSLVVTPSANDDLIVKVINGSGDVIKTARIAGEGQEGEGFGRVNADEDGNYTLTGLELIEGSNATFNLKLEGAQYLEQGVYIYTSEVRDYVDKKGNTNEDVPSQTFVGIAEGYKSVNVSMGIDLTFHVEEGTVTTERTWYDSGENHYHPTGGEDPTPYNDDYEIPEDPEDPGFKLFEKDDLIELEDEEVPLAAVPATSDSTLLWFAMSLLSGAALIRTNRKKEEE